MAHLLTASDRSHLIRQASALPKGSSERRAILAALKAAREKEIAPEVLALKGKTFEVSVNVKMNVKGVVRDVWGDNVDIDWPSSSRTWTSEVGKQVAEAVRKEIGLSEEYEFSGSGYSGTVLPSSLRR